MSDDDIRALRTALADGPTPGPWESFPVGHGSQRVARVNNREVVPPDACELAHEIVDARYIAAASPDRIARLLAEVERLRGALAKANAQAEHFEREWYLRGDEVERLRRDATRYRWLRGDSCMAHSARWTQWEVRRWDAPIWTNDLRRADLDAAIDDAMRKEPDHAR